MADADAGRRKRLLERARNIRSAQPEGGVPERASQFRVVITGKGGVGKTSLTAILARLLAQRGYSVLAVDADPQMNLPYALGLPFEDARALVPLSQNADYIEEKTGARPGSGWGLLLRLNPDVGDVIDRFGVVGPDDVRLLVMGTLTQPATGCLCPENSLLGAVVSAMSLRDGEVILMDTQAGVEHFGRALARGFRQAIVLADPSFNAIQVALRTARFAEGLGIPAVHLVVNRVRSPAEYERALERLEAEGSFPFTTRRALPYDEEVLTSEPAVGPLLDAAGSPFMEAASALGEALVRSQQEAACTP